MPEFPSHTNAVPSVPPAGRTLERFRSSLASQESRDALLVTGARLLQNVLGFVISLAILKKFGLEGVGTFTIASLGVAVLATVLSFGLPFTLAKSDMAVPERNSLGALAGGAAVVLSLPVGLLIGLTFGRDTSEVASIALLAWGGAYFANNSILDALLVLQRKTRRILVVSGFYLAGVAAAAILARTLVEFALLLAAGRFMGLVLVYATLPQRWCGWVRVWQQFRVGARYLVPDSLGLLAEQLSIAILAPLTTRPEMGVYGLCRQFLTAAETPLWSRLVVLYPRVCEQPSDSLRIVRSMAREGIAVMVILILVIAALAKWLYQSDGMLQLGPLLMLAIPLRYIAGTAEISLRALGAVPTVNRLGLIRLALLPLIPAGLYFGRLWGVVFAVIVQGAIMAWLANRALRRAQPQGHP
jgi:O-antigen/teichoic acid export membrane protein